MIPVLLGLKYGKLIAAAIVLSLLIGGLAWYGHNKYNDGYNAAKAEQLKAVLKAETKLRKKYDKIIIRKTVERNNALRMTEQLRHVKQKVIYDEKINTGCDKLNVDAIELFNTAVGSAPIIGPQPDSE